MKLLADENVDRPIVARLRVDGHVVIYVLELEPSIPDPEVASLAAREAVITPGGVRIRKPAVL